MADYPKSPCYQCRNGINALNGRWCPKLKSYVEYEAKAPCRTPFSPSEH